MSVVAIKSFGKGEAPLPINWLTILVYHHIMGYVKRFVQIVFGWSLFDVQCI